MIADSLTIDVVPMHRRHLKRVLRIERTVYARPWSRSLFISELGLRNTRTYFVARQGFKIVGYGGLMEASDEGHITTLAVDPDCQRRGVATQLLLALIGAAQNHHTTDITLEVRVSNHAAQECYHQFGFAPAGIRKNYYPESKEDALVMWVHEIDSATYADRLAGIRARLAGRSQ